MTEVFVPHVGWLTFPHNDRVAQFLNEGWFEFRDQSFLWRFLRRGDVVLDCGAHAGLYSALAAKIMDDDGRVLAIEPNPAMHALLRANVASCLNVVEVVEAAVYSSTTTLQLQVGEGEWSAYSSLFDQGDATTATVEVHATSIDDLLENRAIERVEFCKLDVEGAEVDALRGCERSIAQGRLPLISIEFSEHVLQAAGRDSLGLAAAWLERGYELMRFEPSQGRLVPADVTEPIWYENLYATTEPERVNARLSDPNPAHERIATEIVQRGTAAQDLTDRCDELRNQLELRVDELQSRQREWRAQIEAERSDASARIDKLAEQRDANALECDRLHAQLAATEQRLAAEQRAHRATSTIRVSQATELQASEHALTLTRQSRERLRNWIAEVTKHRAYRTAKALRLVRDPTWIQEVHTASDQLVDGPPPLADLSHRSLSHLASRGFSPGAIVEIGSGPGYWATVARHYFPDARFILFEPDLRHQPKLDALSEQHPNITWRTERLASDNPQAGDMTAQADRLDDLIEDGLIPVPDLIRIDAAENARSVLTGASSALDQAQVVFINADVYRFCEGGDRIDEIVANLVDRKFRLFDIAGTTRRSHDADLGRVELVFASTTSSLVAFEQW